MRTLAVALVLALLVLPVGVHAHHDPPTGGDELQVLAGAPGTTWRAVAFAPDGSHALVVGQHKADGVSRDLIARWTPSGGLEEVHNRSGPGLVDVAFHESGTSLVVGLQDTLLLGEPGDYRDIWDESRFAEQGLTFFGLRADIKPGADVALVGGSSLLRVTMDGEITVLHSGRGAFFRAMSWHPTAPFAWVEAALERDGRALLGTIWRTDGSNETQLSQDDNVQVYGRFNPGKALVNTIQFAPNGSFGLLAGRDGNGGSILSWSSLRKASHAHEGSSKPHDHRWQYLPVGKEQGPITCLAWHPRAGYALATGLDRDVLGFVGPRLYVPTVHKGPDLFGCAFHPSGTYALAVGASGTLVHVRPGDHPLAAVVHPDEGALTAPRANASFLVGVLDRGASGPLSITGQVVGANSTTEAERSGPWWELQVDTRELKDGTHDLQVRVERAGQGLTVTHAFLVNNEAFTPDRPRMQAPSGLEGSGLDADGTFTLHWEALDAPVVYEVQERVSDGERNVTRTMDAGSSSNLTVRATEDGSYVYTVRARNAFNTSGWSEGVVVNVVLDSDGDGVPDAKDPRPFVTDTWGDVDGDGIGDDVEYRQCSDPEDPASTPGSDDDGDGIPNGEECLRGTDPSDPEDPPPADAGDGGVDDGEDREDGNGSPSVGTWALALAVAAVALVHRRRTT